MTIFSPWTAFRPVIAIIFNLRPGQPLNDARVGAASATVPREVDIRADVGFHYASHILRIGDFNEQINFQLSRTWVMKRLDWGSKTLFQVCFDSCMAASVDSACVFAHLRPSV